MRRKTATLILALAAIAGCGEVGETTNGAAAERHGSNQAEAPPGNEATPANAVQEPICNDCPPPNYTGPPLG